MAFRQPQQRAQAQRHASFTSPPVQHTGTLPVTSPQRTSPQRKRALEESQEWILFSPSVDGVTGTASTSQTPCTAGLSRLSDFGSLGTGARSGQRRDDDGDVTCQGTEIDDEDGEELDSLDDGLHAFREPSEYSGPMRRIGQSGTTVLPTHDGLGAFQASNSPMQEQLWQFERYNPRRRHGRRRSSVQKRLDLPEHNEELSQEDEKTQRIERWRMEQSRALLDEIERETRRRRRMSRASVTRNLVEGTVDEEHSEAKRRQDSVVEGAGQVDKPSETETESFWQRLTRRVIQDLMGFDQTTLSVIFGEELAADVPSGTDPSHDSTPQETVSTFAAHSADAWEQRLFGRIARELGILVHQLSEHPGAFSAYVRTQVPSFNAGPPEPSTTDPTNASTAQFATQATPQRSASSQTALHFAPTLPYQSTSTADASLWGIEEESGPAPYDPGNDLVAESTRLRVDRDREYWERELDVKMVFSFLRDRFSLRPSSPSPEPDRATRSATNAAASTSVLGTSPESLRRAAMIRRTHPLVGRNHSIAQQSRRRTLDLVQRRPPPGPIAAIGKRLGGSSSCASQSTKKSKKSSSSRNYWDIGGSVGSGPAMSSATGVWGEA
ncbi:hypothetical protein LTR04_004776 [Oleoguttula sp. CCFEE 6159]|nr:hypothetical protein LTR04_004776 [Oleoguttula sp. CCFEE 6159]